MNIYCKILLTRVLFRLLHRNLQKNGIYKKKYGMDDNGDGLLAEFNTWIDGLEHDYRELEKNNRDLSISNFELKHLAERLNSWRLGAEQEISQLREENIKIQKKLDEINQPSEK